MASSHHLHALQRKHEHLEHLIHDEMLHVARDEFTIRRLKTQKLHVKEEIDRLSEP